MTREVLLPPYTAEEKLRELCMRNRFLCGRMRHNRKKSRELAAHSAMSTSRSPNRTCQPNKIPKPIQTMWGKWVTIQRTSGMRTLSLRGSGIRESELASLQLADVDLANDELIVREGKGKKERNILIMPELAKAIQAYVREREQQLIVDVDIVFLARYALRSCDTGPPLLLGLAGILLIGLSASK